MTANTAQQTQGEALLHAQDYLQVLKTRWKEALLVFLLVFVSCAVITKMMTPRYTSSMTAEVMPPREIINVSNNSMNPINAVVSETASYMQTQFEIMVSQQNLIAIANKLDLPNEWKTDEVSAAGMLSGMIKVMPRKNTNLVDISVENSDPRVAQQICQAVVDCYRELREEKENAVINEAINKRYEVLRSRQDELERKADVVRQFIRTGRYIANIWNETGAGTPQSTGAEEVTLQKLNDQRLTLDSEIANMMVHIDKLQNLKDEELLSYVTRTGLLTAESYCSAKVRELNTQYSKEEDERNKMLLMGYGEQHPVLLRLEEQHASTREQLYAELLGMRDAMVDQLDVKKSESNSLKERYEEAKKLLKDKTLEDQKVKSALQEYAAEKQRYDKLENDYIADKMRMLAPRACMEVYSRPGVASVPTSPNYRLNLIVGAVLGCILGIIVAFVFDCFDTSIKTLEDAERGLGLPVLGVIPQDAGLLILQGNSSPDAEAYRILRTNIELKKSLYKATTFAVVSSNAGEGKTTTLSNLAYVFAQAGYSTLMVDADLRRPRLARYAELKSDVGLSNYLAGTKELKEVIFQTGIPNLYLMPSGPIPADPSGMIGSFRMEQLISEVSKRFDVVLFDSPPVLGVSDASLLVSKADASLLVLQPRKMPLKALLRTKFLIQNAGGQVMGLIMNNVDISGDTQYQYYTTYYSYYSSDRKRKEPVTPGLAAATRAKGAETQSGEDSQFTASKAEQKGTSSEESGDLY
ncbi:MAG: polysaccharide biosynthesis tyrosine autokinase [Akkermansia sp.]|nr:polysaccharide biosynthesis tyrosine autokinase [Akkermansia sp.]